MQNDECYDALRIAIIKQAVEDFEDYIDTMYINRNYDILTKFEKSKITCGLQAKAWFESDYFCYFLPEIKGDEVMEAIKNHYCKYDCRILDINFREDHKRDLPLDYNFFRDL